MNKRGFTLIELLIAIAMIGVLAATAVVMINPLEQIKKGRDAQRKHDLNQLPIIMEAYISDFKRYPEAQNGLIKGVPWGDPWEGYLAKLPKDPLSPQQDYSYEVAQDGSWYRLCAKLERCNDPQRIPEAECSSYNYSISSPNIANPLCRGTILAPTPTAIPTPTLIPTNTPTPTPTSTPIPTPTPTPTPLPTKYVFVTSQEYSADLGGLTGADAKCKSLADAPASVPAVKNKIWKAWLSTSTENAIGRIINRRYIRIDGNVIARDKTDLIDGTIAYPINITETNVIIARKSVWTGTDEVGNFSSPNCNGWTTTNSAISGRAGNSSSVDRKWTSDITPSCIFFGPGENTLPLYCFEQ